MRTLRTPLYPILLQASLFLFPALLSAGARKIQVQGKLTNAAGVPLTGAQTVTFKLWPALTGGTATWNSGALSVTPSTGGLFNVALQDGTPSLDTLTFYTPYFLGITVGADAEMTPRQELGSAAASLGSASTFEIKSKLTIKDGNLVLGSSTCSYVSTEGVGPLTLRASTSSAKGVTISTAGVTTFGTSLAVGGSTTAFISTEGTGALSLRASTSSAKGVTVSTTGCVSVGTNLMLSGSTNTFVSTEGATPLILRASTSSSKGVTVSTTGSVGVGTNLMLSGSTNAYVSTEGTGPLYLRASSSSMNGMSLSTGGYLGIGTTNPGNIVEVSKSGDPLVLFRNNQGLTVGNTSRMQFWGGVSTTTDVSLLATIGGEVTAINPLKSKLTFRVNGGNNSAEVAWITSGGDMHAASFISTSDARLKTDIKPLDSAGILGKLQAIRGVQYKWNEGMVAAPRDDNAQVGLLAQEVEAQFPELISTWKAADGVSYKGINYGGMVPVLLEAIKAQQAQIEDLKRRMQAFEAK